VLAAQLGSIKWTVDSRGHIKIESKDDIESHQGQSITGDLMEKAW
jgi:hypothetical protein